MLDRNFDEISSSFKVFDSYMTLKVTMQPDSGQMVHQICPKIFYRI